MQSRQIQIFGLLATSLLILFIVIFLGKDFYRLYQSYTQSASLPGLDEDQIVMESYAVENLKEMLDMEQGKGREPAIESKEAAAGNAPDAIRSGAEAAKPAVTLEEAASAKRPLQQMQHRDSVESEEIAVAAEKSAPAVVPAPQSLAERNRRIHRMLQRAHLFANGTEVGVLEKKLFESVVALLKSLDFPYSLEIEGHTRAGSPGGADLQMARAAAAYMQERLPGVAIKTVGYGNRYPISDDPRDPANRRVEIIVRRRGE